MQRTIRSVDELRALRPRGARRGLRRVTLALPGDPAARRRTEATINRGLRACGCQAAAVVLAAGIAVIALACAGHPCLGWLRPGASWWAVLGGLFGLTLVGKVLGLAWAEWRLRVAIDRVLTQGEAQ